MPYRRCGRSGVQLPALSLGLWHNFGANDNADTAQNILRTAFDHGICHFDLANNYGPPYGSAESTLGTALRGDFATHRDELFISSKAGYDMWPGPYGDHGSRKYLTASLDQSLRRLGLDYVDVFYHHRPDPDTPLEETMQALSDLVRAGKALYAAISNYPADLAAQAIRLLRANGTPCLLHQPKYSMFVRWVEKDLLGVLESEGVGCIVFSPLAEGLLTGKYLGGIPDGSRAARPGSHIKKDWLSDVRQHKIAELGKVAAERGQTLSQLALSWLLRDKRITSVLMGASSPAQLLENLQAVHAPAFASDELDRIETILDNKTEYASGL
ncbi:MAG: aldo/keto reductase [Spirochaetes bacterium]|nr:aldo/keto reductase [Spirochaetota bacterium]